MASGYGIPVTAPEESLAESFRAVARELRRRTLVALEPWDVTPSQARALGMLHRHGAMRLRDLAEHLRIAPRSATEVVDDLAGRGLVDRHPDPDDRRAVLVRPTERGEATARAIRAARVAGADDFFAALDEDDRAALARILTRLRS